MSDDDKNESFLEHLEALRQALLKCIYALAVVLPFMFLISPKALDLLTDWISAGNNVKFNFFTPAEVFLIQIKLAFVLDLTVCFPYILNRIWNFILPALYEHEKKFIKAIVLISSILFVSGVIFCIAYILPLMIKFGMSFQSYNIVPVLGLSNIMNLTLWLGVISGLMFQIPIATFFLIKSGMADYKTIAGKRPYIIVGLLIISAILTPPDVISQLMLAVPAYLLFETGLVCAGLFNK